MKNYVLLAGVAGVSLMSGVHIAQAQSLSVSNDGIHAAHSMDHGSHHDHHMHGTDTEHHHGGPNAPVSVMGDHLHPEGGWMLSYRFQQMKMDGNRDGTDDLSPVEIATTYANRFNGVVSGQPPTLRVVPTEMTMDMHMFGAMYGVTDWLTVMGMAMWMDKSMDLTTFAMASGTTVRGTFETESKGWSDTSISSLIRLYQKDNHQLHLNLGLSIPTGSLKEEDDVLPPMGSTMRMRLPYSMQLGTGTYDLHPGLTYTGHTGSWGWGAQYKGEIRLEDDNSQGYAWGDKHSVTGWGAYQWKPWISTSLRLEASTQDSIDGIDSHIVAPVQTADPDNYGGEIVEAGFGVNLTGVEGWTKGQTIGIEFTAPLYQDLNGPQMKRDYGLTLGWRKSF